MDFRSKVTQESTTTEGVRFTVRVLNVIQRARRDSALIDARNRHAELWAQWFQSTDPDEEITRIRAAVSTRELTPEENERIAAINRDPATQAARLIRLKLNDAMNILQKTELWPASIRAGLVSVDGLTSDGQPVATADQLLDGPFDDLIGEIYVACESASGLTGEQRKNSQSPSTSPEAEGAAPTPTTATTASE